MGKKLYPVYRRIRFLLYKKRRQKQIKKSNKRFVETDAKPDLKKTKTSLNFRIYRIYRLSRFALKKWKINRVEKKERVRLQICKEKIERIEINRKIREKRLEDRKLDQAKKKEEKDQLKEERRLRRLDRKAYRKEKWRQFAYEIKNFDRHTLKRWFRGIIEFAANRDKRHSFFVISINSLVLFLFSYLVIFIIGQFITIWVASTFDYKTILYYYKIYYDIESHAWNSDSVKILFSILPLSGILLGTVFLILYSLFRNEPGNLKLFFLWGFVHGMVMFFGALLMGTLLNKDFGWVIAYLYYRDTGKMIFSIISIFALIAIGGLIAKSFLISGNAYYNFIDKRNRQFFLSSQIILPAILGSVVLAFLKIPDRFYFGTVDEMYYEFLKLFTLMLLIVPLFISFKTYNEIYFDEEPRRISLNWKFLIIAIALILIFRLGLVTGITFGG